MLYDELVNCPVCPGPPQPEIREAQHSTYHTDPTLCYESLMPLSLPLQHTALAKTRAVAAAA